MYMITVNCQSQWPINKVFRLLFKIHQKLLLQIILLHTHTEATLQGVVDIHLPNPESKFVFICDVIPTARMASFGVSAQQTEKDLSSVRTRLSPPIVRNYCTISNPDAVPTYVLRQVIYCIGHIPVQGISMLQTDTSYLYNRHVRSTKQFSVKCTADNIFLLFRKTDVKQNFDLLYYVSNCFSISNLSNHITVIICTTMNTLTAVYAINNHI